MYKALGISGSLRRASANSGLLRFARSVMPDGMALEIAEIAEVPLYNQDKADDPPAAVLRVLERIGAADALVLAEPEYNYSLAPALKNVLDWASRVPGNPLLRGKPVAIMGAAGGMGSSRAQYHLRQVCVVLDLYPLAQPEVFADAYTGFDQDGELLDEQVRAKVREQMRALLDWTRRLRAPGDLAG